MASHPTFDTHMVVRARARVGSTLGGKYRLDALLGLGGMGAVYRATHRNGAVFAVKVLHPEFALHQDVRTRFQREGYIANSVKHDGVPRVIDDEAADGEVFTVMELLEGVSVDELATHLGGTLPMRVVVALGLAVLDVLTAAHAAGVTHRDLKPANLFVRFDGRVVLLDFGVARVYDAATSGGLSTATGVVLGTPAFIAPETAAGDKAAVSALTDLWSLGATLFTLATGRTVHVAETGPQFLVAAVTRDAPPLRELVPDAPVAVAGVLDRALVRTPAERWPSATAMREALAEAARTGWGDVPSRADLVQMFPDRTTTFEASDAITLVAHTSGPTPPPGVDALFRAVVQTVRELGVDVEAALAAAGIDLHATAVSADLVHFLEHAARISQKPSLGIEVATHIPLGASGGLDYATRTSSTFHEALERTQRLFTFVSDRARLVLEEEGDRIHIIVERNPGAPTGPQVTEFVTAIILSRARDATRSTLAVRAVHYTHARVPGAQDLAAVFGAPVLYEQERDEIVLPRSMSFVRFETSDPALAELLERHTSRLVSRGG